MFQIDISKQLGEFALQPAFEAGREMTVLFGPSGCGKSLTLQAVAGLLRPDAGRIVLPGGAVAFDADTKADLPPQTRGIGYVVQDLALFPHLTARENIEFGMSTWPAGRRRDRRSGGRSSSRAGSSNGWRWRARWRGSRRCCCSTSRSRRSTRRSAGRSGARSRHCAEGSISPFCS
jgi:molybdate transport system ATP-binding protein